MTRKKSGEKSKKAKLNAKSKRKSAVSVKEGIPSLPEKKEPEVAPTEEGTAPEKNDGAIEDLLVFKMAYLESRVTEAVLQIQLRDKVYTERIQALKVERMNVIRQWEQAKNEALQLLGDLKTELEKKHHIRLGEYSYDDITGVLKRLPDDQIEAMKNAAKQKEEAVKTEEAARQKEAAESKGS